MRLVAHDHDGDVRLLGRADVRVELHQAMVPRIRRRPRVDEHQPVDAVIVVNAAEVRVVRKAPLVLLHESLVPEEGVG